MFTTIVVVVYHTSTVQSNLPFLAASSLILRHGKYSVINPTYEICALILSNANWKPQILRLGGKSNKTRSYQCLLLLLLLLLDLSLSSSTMVCWVQALTIVFFFFFFFFFLIYLFLLQPFLLSFSFSLRSLPPSISLSSIVEWLLLQKLSQI